jgi:hypothetical protein
MGPFKKIVYDREAGFEGFYIYLFLMNFKIVNRFFRKELKAWLLVSSSKIVSFKNAYADWLRRSIWRYIDSWAGLFAAMGKIGKRQAIRIVEFANTS